jgi:RNA polymerase sigma-70 factor (ECF subfamily)
VEQRCWEQMQQGERRHSVFAVILGVTHLPENEQRREVKRMKDRLKKRKQRARGKHDQSS